MRFFEKGFKFKVESITNHPEYNSSTQYADVAVWKLKLIRGKKKNIPSGIVELDDGRVAGNLLMKNLELLDGVSPKLMQRIHNGREK